MEMNADVKGIAQYLTREAIRGWYDKYDMTTGDTELAIMRAYFVLMKCIRSGPKDERELARELARTILMSYWGRPLGNLDISGERFRRASYDVYRALKDSITKTLNKIK